MKGVRCKIKKRSQINMLCSMICFGKPTKRRAIRIGPVDCYFKTNETDKSLELMSGIELAFGSCFTVKK